MKYEKLEELCRSLIHHGRHFSETRDSIVIKKSVEYILKIFQKGGDRNDRCRNIKKVSE